MSVYRIPAPGSDAEFHEDLAYLTSLSEIMPALIGDRLYYPHTPSVESQLCATMSADQLAAVYDRWPSFAELWDAA